MVQDAPGPTGVNMPVSLIAELSKLDGVASVKVETQPTAPKVGAVVEATSADFLVLGGQNALFVLEEYARGAVGTMPACEFPDLLAPVLRSGISRSLQPPAAADPLRPAAGHRLVHPQARPRAARHHRLGHGPLPRRRRRPGYPCLPRRHPARPGADMTHDRATPARPRSKPAGRPQRAQRGPARRR